ncbi:MAG: osmoprotectant NAGGN system M42 family peptidase [Inquilinaceae bacterium]
MVHQLHRSPAGEPDIDTDYMLDVLVRLLETPSPSGFTDRVVHLVCAELDALNIAYEITRRGAIRADLPGQTHTPDRAIVGHVDTLGAQVKALKDNGRLEIVPIGTWSSRFAEGGRVTIFTDDAAFRGTVLPLKASGHTFNEEVDSQPVTWENLEVRVDEMIHDRPGLEGKGFNIGDFVAFDTGADISHNGFINARHLDDKAGVAAMLAAAKTIVDGKIPLTLDCHLLFTISEEVGSGASAVLHGDVAEMVTVDNGTQAPGQNSRETGVTVAMRDSVGPFDYHLTRRLIGLCEEKNIPYQRDAFRFYRSDSASAVEAGNDIRTALICFGIDASHGYERTHIDAILSVARLLTAYMQSPPMFQRDRRIMGPMEDFPDQDLPAADGGG